MAMHHGALKAITFFQNKDPTFIVSIVPLLKPLQSKYDEVIFSEGDPPSEVYFIIEGRVEFWMSHVMFKTMINGSYFGEVDVLFNQPRGYLAWSATNTEMLTLERNQFIDNLDQYPEIADEVIILARVRKMQNEECLAEIIEAIENH